MSVDTVKEYITYLESAFLVMRMEKWTTSYSEKVYAQKKIYLMDTGIKTLLTGHADKGIKVENAVFMKLKRKNIACGYFAESEKEVDFVTGDIKHPLPIEAKYISSLDWKDRRFGGIKLFLRRYPNTEQVIIITKTVETRTNLNGTEIILIPAWRFLLSGWAGIHS